MLVFLVLLTGTALSIPFPAHGQNAEISAPEDSYILEMTRWWGKKCSSLGEMHAMNADSGDVAVRFWGGYGIDETRGISLRRIRSEWKAKAVRVERRKVEVPDSIRSDSTAVRQYVNDLSRNACTVVSRFGPGQNFVMDTVRVSEPPKTPDLDKLWKRLRSHGILRLPPDPEEAGVPVEDGHTYVVEVRTGNQYRSSVIPGIVLFMESSRDEGEHSVLQQVKEIASLLQNQLGVQLSPPN